MPQQVGKGTSIFLGDMRLFDDLRAVLTCVSFRSQKGPSALEVLSFGGGGFLDLKDFLDFSVTKTTLFRVM